MNSALRIAALVALLLPSLVALENDAARRDQLKRLRGAIAAYGMLNPGKVPAKLSALMDENLLDGPGSLLRPGATLLPPRAEIDARADYTLDPLPGMPDLVVREKAPLAGESEILAIFKDGTVKSLPVDPKEATGPSATPGTTSNPPTPKSETVRPRPPGGSTDGVLPKKDPDRSSRPSLRDETRDRPPPRSENPGIALVNSSNTGRPAPTTKEALGFAFDRAGRLLIASVNDRELAGMLGIRVGDQVTELEDKAVPPKPAGPVSLADLARLSGVAAGDDLILGIRHADGAVSTVALPTPGGEPPVVQLIPPGTLVAPQRRAPDAPGLGVPRVAAFLGAGFADPAPSRNGAWVSEVVRHSPAESAGLKVGDSVIALEGEPVANGREVVAALAKKSPGARVDLLVHRGGRNIKVSVTLGARPTVDR